MPPEGSKDSDRSMLEEKKKVVHYDVAGKEEYSANEGEQEDLDHGGKMRRWQTVKRTQKSFVFFKSLG